MHESVSERLPTSPLRVRYLATTGFRLAGKQALEELDYARSHPDDPANCEMQHRVLSIAPASRIRESMSVYSSYTVATKSPL